MEIEIWQLVLLILAAFCSGFIDAIAGGGGLITVPALLSVGIPPHVALATNKAQAVFGSATAAFMFYKKGFYTIKEVALGVIFTLIGAIVGTRAVLLMNADFLRFIIPFLLVGILIYTIFSPKLGDEANSPKFNQKILYAFFGFCLGFYDGFFGPGTGSFWTFALISLVGLSMKSAIAQTKAFNFTSNIVSLSVFILGGEILWIVGLSMGIASMLGGIFGSNFVIKKDIKIIRAIFLFVVSLVLLKLIFDFF